MFGVNDPFLSQVGADEGHMRRCESTGMSEHTYESTNIITPVRTHLKARAV